MSLAMAVIQPNFIIASSDTAVTKFPFDEKLYQETGKLEKTDEMIKTDFKSQKTHKLTDQVLMLSVGQSTITETFKVEMLERVSPDHDLQASMTIAKEVLKNMKEGIIPHHKKVLENLSIAWNMTPEEIEEGYWIELKNMDSLQFSASLVGFNADGTSGVYYGATDEYGQTPDDLRKGYHLIIDGHHPGYSKDPKNLSIYQQQLAFKNPEERTIANFTDAMTLVHGRISYESNVNVSSDCHFHVILRTNSGYEYANIPVETSFLHPYFKQELEPN